MPSDYDLIRDDNIRRRGEEFDDIGRLISEQLYGDRAHFIFELLQNAEDALERQYRDRPNNILPYSVKFLLFKDRLEFRHFGQPFNEKDVRGICDVLKGTKREDRTQIGKFGIGFKSVYAFTATPEIHSGDEHFIIERYIRPKAANRLSEVISDETIFLFPFNHENLSPEKAHDLIAERLRKLGSRVLLFLNRLDEIEWSIEKTDEKGQYLKETRFRSGAKQVTVIGQKNQQEEEENWLVFERSLFCPNPKANTKIEIGFKLEAINDSKSEQIKRLLDSPLIVYFPTKLSTLFGFLIQGPYDTIASRSDIEDNDWNKKLLKETAVLITEALEHLKYMGLMTVALLESLPIRMDDFKEDGMFYPIVAAVRASLMEQELLPADDGTFVSARSAKLARGAELRKLLNHSQLKELFQSNDEIKWLSGEITQDRTPELRLYLMHELNVEEITPDKFARKVFDSFLSDQSDEWIISFYRYISDQKPLWKVGSGYSDPPGPLRNKPFIRLQDGAQVTPFGKDNSYNAFVPVEGYFETALPIVKIELCNDEEVRKFLKALEIPELDIVEEVIERVLPKYSGDSPKIIIDEHFQDIRKIKRAYSTDFPDKKLRLKNRLQSTAFIHTYNPSRGSNIYRKPYESYFHNTDLLTYFSGNEDFSYVDNNYDESVLMIFHDLGVTKSVRVRVRESNQQGHVTIKNVYGSHERGRNGFDPDIQVDGLVPALANPTFEKSSYIWNNIAKPHSVCIRGIVEKSKRHTYETSETEEQVSEFGRLLMDMPWLPGRDNKFYKPIEISLDDLPESFIRDEKLADHLGMKKDVVAKLAEEAGVHPEDIEWLKQHPEAFRQFKVAIAAKQESAFPTKTSADIERREKKIIEKYKNAPKKTYEKVTQSTKTTKNTIDGKAWLNETYKNAGKLICQICKEEMPFKKRDGNYYFEAIEILSDFDREMEELYIALCPVCSAKYNEFVKQDEAAMKTFKNALVNSEEPEIPLKLGELNTSIRFVETHYQDIKTIITARE